MSDGDLSMQEAVALQRFTGRKECGHSAEYEGTEPPSCFPPCEACFEKWLAQETDNG